jgi:nitrite reductase/ring-hydroxylating ferredoxin subunit
LINLEGSDTEGFYFAATAADIADGRITAITINKTPIILTRLNDTIYAFGALCPHASGDLTQGELHRGRIDCPDHGYRFDIRSGFPVWPEDEVCRLKKYPVIEEDGELFLKV